MGNNVQKQSNHTDYYIGSPESSTDEFEFIHQVNIFSNDIGTDTAKSKSILKK